MIVPRTRLLFCVAALVLPLALVAGVYPNLTLLAVLLILTFLALAALDAAISPGVLAGIGVELPEVVRLSKDRDGALDILIRNDSKRPRLLRLGLPLPREIHSPDQELDTLLPADADLSRLSWPCRPLKRGNYILDRACLEGSSPLGFWAIRATRPVRSEIRVYPNLLDERKSVAALFLNRGNFGAHALRQVGKGRDFEKLREYIPGDSYEDIHWKATAKRGHPVTKVFQIERTQEVYVIIDSSRLSARLIGQSTTTPTPPGNPELETRNPEQEPHTTLLERYINAGLILGMAAEQQGDLFGLITFSDRVDRFVRAKNGKVHYSACRDALYTLQPRVVTPDFDELCAFIRLRLRRRALLLFLTALDDPILAESFVKNMDLICRQHLILVNMMRPPGAVPMFSDPNVTALDDIYQRLGGHVQWHNLRELDKTLQRRGVRFSLLANEKMSAQVVTQYLDVKRRQLI